MKLCVDIIFERLSRKYPIKMYGEGNGKMVLHAPELYIDNTLQFYADHVYLATVEHLPQRPRIEKNVVLVCIGESARLSYYKEHATVLLIKKKVDFFEVYKSIQGIYELFHNWESQLLELFMKSPSIQDVLNCTYSVLERPIFILDTSFQFVAATSMNEATKDGRWSQNRGSLDPEAFLEFLREKDLSLDRKGAFLLEFEAGNVLCVNLFNESDEYMGCLCIDQCNHSFVGGEDKIAEYVASMIEKVSELSPVLLKNEHSSLRETLRNIMNEMPMSKNQKLLLRSSNNKQSYICISMHCLKRFLALPVGYLCSVLENLFPESIFFEQNNTILGMILLDGFEKENQLTDELKAKIIPMMEEMQLCVGVSNSFSDLYMLRTYYFQAEAAIENGELYKPDQKLHFFSEFALTEMVANSLGGFPLEAYFPNGFRKLQTHDQVGAISYLETLAVFLEENMSYAKAARRLFVHRSTLIERISRIESELEIDFNDPDQRLQLQIILKALSIEKRMDIE